MFKQWFTNIFRKGSFVFVVLFKVSKLWVQKLIELQSGKELHLASKLTQAHINSTNYQNINVGMAAQVANCFFFVSFSFCL